MSAPIVRVTPGQAAVYGPGIVRRLAAGLVVAVAGVRLRMAGADTAPPPLELTSPSGCSACRSPMVEHYRACGVPVCNHCGHHHGGAACVACGWRPEP